MSKTLETQQALVDAVSSLLTVVKTLIATDASKTEEINDLKQDAIEAAAAIAEFTSNDETAAAVNNRLVSEVQEVINLAGAATASPVVEQPVETPETLEPSIEPAVEPTDDLDVE